MLKFENVTGITKKGKEDDFKLQDISFHLEEGYLCGLVGKNGAGKSTLFRTILNENAQYEGKILYRGMDIREYHSAFLSEVAYVADENTFFMNKSVAENIDLLGQFFPQWQKGYFYDLMRKFEVPTRQVLCNFSRGEFIEFQIAFGMAHHARLYLLDEATAGMDPVFRVDFYNVLREILAEGDCSILMSTQLQTDLNRNMDFIARMENGRMVSFEENMA